jgi:ZIP family zinc transporter
MELKQMGLITGLAIALHNFPEGLATFVATLADARLGIAVAFAIALHNIPEGLCVAMPLYYSTGSRTQGFLWAFASGLSEPFGGLVGYVILRGSDMHPVAYGIVFAIVAGMMVYISFQELLPTALRYDPGNGVTVKAVFVGMAVMDLSLILFQF